MKKKDLPADTVSKKVTEGKLQDYVIVLEEDWWFIFYLCIKKDTNWILKSK